MSLSQEYKSRPRGRRGGYGRRINGKLRVFLTVLGILLISVPIAAVLDGADEKRANRAEERSGTASVQMLAPLPMQGREGGTAVQYGPERPGEGAGLVPYNSEVIRLPARGQAELSYFSDAAFLGDSLTEGLIQYNTNIGGALVCAYTGIGPDAVVNRTSVHHMKRGNEVALDVLREHAPKKLYILLGTNTLTTEGAEDRFFAYYERMLDQLRETLGSDCIFYVQSVPPVRPKAEAEKPGLSRENLKNVNERLARLADDKGCVYLDLWEALADADGYLNDRLDAPDGIHLSPGNGYSAWITYLRTHTVYDPNTPWTPGSAYAR